MSLETPSPPDSYGPGHPWGDDWVRVSPLCHGFILEVVPNQRCQHTLDFATLPNLRLCPKHSHPSRSRSLLGWAGWLAGWLRASAAGHGTATQAPPASCQPRGPCAPGRCSATGTLPGGGRDALHRAEGAQAPAGD